MLPVAAESWPSGPASAETHERLCRLVLDEVERGGFDAILLDLHGAMVAEGVEDAEGDLLRRLREIDPTTPVAVTLDMHANLYDDIVRHATVISGFHTYPHVDIHAAGLRAANVIVRTLRGDQARHALGQQAHAAARDAPGHARRTQQIAAGALHRAGGARRAGGVGVRRLPACRHPRSGPERRGLYRRQGGAGGTIARRTAGARLGRPRRLGVPSGTAGSRHYPRQGGDTGAVVLLDHYDNTGSGGTMDTTAVLAEMLRQGLDNAVFYAICDPQAAREAAAAGVGSQIRIKLGGKVAMPAIRQASEPLEISGRVKLVFDGVYLNRGPMYRGVRNDTGLTVVIDTGSVEIVVVSRHQEPFDVNCLLSAGIDPLQKRYVALKSRVHWRAGFSDMATDIIDAPASA